MSEVLNEKKSSQVKRSKAGDEFLDLILELESGSETITMKPKHMHGLGKMMIIVAQRYHLKFYKDTEDTGV